MGLMFNINIILLISLLFKLIKITNSYIPALPSNQTTINLSSNNSINDWIVQLNWLPIGIFSDAINHLLTSDSVNRSIHQGVLLHFSELNATTQPPTTVPWIAMINCDSNSTISSTQDDIFTLARDRGASAAMLYSSTSRSCLVNDHYIQNFEKPLDVFSAGSLQGARLIESQFSNVLSAGYWFQSDLLNASASVILQQIKSLGLSNLESNPTTTSSLSIASPLQTSSSTIQSPSRSVLSEATDDHPLSRRSTIHEPYSYQSTRRSLVARASHPSPEQTIHVKLNLNSTSHRANSLNADNSPVFLIATLANAQVTGNLDLQRNQNSNFQANPNRSNANSNTGLAMIILYVITGCVSFMFLVVIVSGAIRALRNPDRYGPRPGGRVDPETGEEDPYAQPRQTRAEGLGKAILDTFPIVKFGRQNNSVHKDSPESVQHDASSTKELKLNLQENIELHPDQENIMMSERGQKAELPSPNHSFISNTAPPIGNKPVLPNQNDIQSNDDDDDDEIGSILSERGPYPLVASQIPLLSQPHLSSSSNKVTNNLSKSEPQMILHTNQSSDLKPQEDHSKQEACSQTSNLPAKNHDDEAENVQSTLTAVNNFTTCPICVCEFEDDDDIRMLPCDARHQFHKECVDPWLLNESRFCPLCRWDLSTRKDGSKIETEIIVESEIEVEPTSPQTNRQQGETEEAESNDPSESQNRFKIRPAWLSLCNRHSTPPSTTINGQASPAGTSSSRSHNHFSIVPRIRRGRKERNATINQNSNDVIIESHSEPSSSNSNPPVDLNVNPDTNTHTHADTNTHNSTENDHNQQEFINSHNRFLKYIHQIRHHKK